jgi:hypothetical protein
LASNFKEWRHRLGAPVFHLRVIISWGGFSKQQIASVKKHNAKYPNQPMLLVAPWSIPLAVCIYGEVAANRLNADKALPREPPNSGDDVDAELLKVLHMELEEDESGKVV